MPSPITITSYSASGSGIRHNPPAPWLPRWFNAWTDQDSTLRNLQWASTGYWAQDLSQQTGDYYQAHFWGAECTPHTAYVSNYQWSKKYVPTCTLAGSLVRYQTPTTLVYAADTLGSFLYEAKNPVMYVDENGVLWFRNLANVQTTIQAVSGYLDITPVVADTRIPDTPLIITNQWGDDQYVDNVSYSLAGNRLFVGENLVYTVTWTSSALHSTWLSGTSYVTVDGVKLSLSDYSIPNVWDARAGVLGIVRRERETNVSVKRKIQHISFCSKPEIMISAALGQSVSWYWNPTNTLNLQGSSITAIEIPEYDDYEYRTETLVQDGSVFRSLYIPASGLTQVYFNQLLVPSSEYAVTGGVFMPLVSRLKDAGQGSVYANYKVLHFTTSVSGYYVMSVVPGNSMPQSVYAFGSRKVKVQNKSKRVRVWKWNSESPTNRGAATFEQ